MKNRILSRVLGCTLISTLILGSLAACSKENVDTNEQGTSEESIVSVASEATEEITYPLEDVTLSIAMVASGTVNAHYKGREETPFWSAWQEQTGVKLELTEVTDYTALNLLYAGGELPDIIIASLNNYTGGASKAIEDKIVEPLNNYMEYAPDLQAVFDSNDLYYKSCVTPEGDIVGFPFVRGDDYLCTSYGIIARADWLNDLGKDIPETPDELYDVLKSFKEEMGAEVPLTVSSGTLKTWWIGHGLLAAGFGLPAGNFYQVDGVVHYGFAEKELKSVLIYLKKLYDDGLLDPNFSTLDDAMVKSNILDGRSGVTSGSPGGNMGSWLKAMADDDTYDLVGVGSMTPEKGEVSTGGHKENAVTGMYAFITPQCKNIEAAMKFLNYGYTEAGHMLFNFGIEGESYTLVDGEAIFTEWITDNPDGWSMTQAMSAYCNSWNSGPFVQDKGYMTQYAGMQQQINAITTWMDNDRGDYIIPNITINTDDAAEFSRLASEIDAYVDEMLVKFISGLISIDAFESEYLPTIKQLGVDRYIEIEQNALDEFNSR